MAANWKCQDCGEVKFGGAPGVCLSCGGDDFEIMGEPRLKRVEKAPEGGWIARRQDGSIIGGDDWRWNSRSVARSVVAETDMLERAQP